MEGMLNRLFDDKTVKVLSHLRDKKMVQIRDTSRVTSIPPATVFRIFKKLILIGLLEKESKGSFNYYKVNSNHESLFILEKLMPKIKPLDVFVQNLPKDNLDTIALLDEAENRASLLVIGDVKQAVAHEIAEQIKAEFNFSIKVLVLSKAQYENLDALNLKPNSKKVLFQNKP